MIEMTGIDGQAVERLIESNDACELTASSHQDFAGSQVLKHDDTFLLVDKLGEAGVPEPNEQGLYHSGTRFLSRWEFKLGGQSPKLLNSTVKEDNSLMIIQMTNPDLWSEPGEHIPHGTLHLFRSLIVRDGTLYEQLTVTNYAGRSIATQINYCFDADYKDIFEIRGAKRSRRGDFQDTKVDRQTITLGYLGLDGELRNTQVEFTDGARIVDARNGLFDIELSPGEKKTFEITVNCGVFGTFHERESHQSLHDRIVSAVVRDADTSTRITTSNEQFNQWIKRSDADLTMLVTKTEHGIFPYAGVPWFAAPFGRDGLITALETLWFAPGLAKGTLGFLAQTQATGIEQSNEAEPGKIIHEMRKGEMAALGETPFQRYYGTVDATPLFVILAGRYFCRTNDFAFIKSIWESIRAAVRWIDDFGDADGDGFVEYESHNRQGLVHQCWKDSDDSIFHADGRNARGPIAASEVQGYVYAAKLAAADLAELMDESQWANELRAQACQLQTRFHDAFWVEELGTYAIALDGEKQPCKVRNSNAGHLLFSGIVKPAYASRVCEALTDHRAFNGWGIRTISEGEARYNPMSYHNGSVWPHDTSLGVAGICSYGYLPQAMPVIEGLFGASQSNELYRLPELFCGFDRIMGHGPTLYPVACSPQAWAAGSVFMLLQSIMGLSFSPTRPQIRFDNPELPAFLSWVKIENLQVGNGSVDLVLRRHPRDVGLSVERKEGDIEIVVMA